MTDLVRRLFAEALGTALLLAIVLGSGVMAESLAGGNVAVALLANTLATVCGLFVLIEVFGPVSGAHFNPVVSGVMAWRGHLPRADLGPYVLAQLAGAMLGAWLAHAMFEMPVLQFSTKLRGGIGQWVAEAVATAGLLLVILRAPASRVAPARRTGSPPRPRLPTRLRSSAECSVTASRASLQSAHLGSSWRRPWARPSVWPSIRCCAPRRCPSSSLAILQRLAPRAAPAVSSRAP